MPPNNTLTVYKASAGSGKTFTLAIEYIKLLLNNPISYRNILAVTFTNKATEEMKMRILSQLYGLAHGYEDSKNYCDRLVEELHCTEEFVRERAAMALSSLIHHYSYFRVETIDKFFQRILRNLARELDLTANLRIELNDKQVEQQAVDTMIEQLNNDDKVLGWVMNYILETIQDDKSWNVIKQVKEFGENIFKDDYKKHRKRLHEILSEDEFFNKYRDQLVLLRKESLEKMAGHADRFFACTQGYEEQDFAYGKSGVYNYFVKLREGKFDGGEPGKRVTECMEDPGKWTSAKAPHRVAITQLAEQQLIAILTDAEKDRRECYKIAKSAEVTRQHLYQLRLLGNIEDKVRQLNQNANRFLLSDTQGMLHDLIDDSDTPFIYEKMGAVLKHIMIDEFQDTGRLQWANFKILLQNCMDQGAGNLIVGDVKQSIYRWRSGDWRLLNSIENEFGQPNEVYVQPLKVNYRSCRKVILFNNCFFENASALEYERLHRFIGQEAEELKTAYSDVSQEVPSDRPDNGYVRIEVMPKKVYDEKVMENIADTIRSLKEQGVAESKIAILARRNDDIQATAVYFQKYVTDINVISDEAFRLDASISVCIIITALRVLSHPNDLLRKASLAKYYQNDVLKNQVDDDRLLLSVIGKEAADAYQEWLPQGFCGAESQKRLKSMAMTDLLEELFIIFQLERIEGQSAYICTLYDLISDLMNDNVVDIETVLDAWDENLCSKTIHGDDIDGVRIVSIHKSKGLEFDNVILPFCSWQLEKSYTIWCDSTHEPFNQLPILPVDYSKTKLIDTVYEDDYKHEHLQNSVDNLNLLYVAFTRAKTRLFIFAHKKEEKKDDKKKSKSDSNPKSETHTLRSELIEQCLPALERDLEGSVLEHHEDGSDVFEYGDCFETTIAPKKKPTQNIFLQKEQSEALTMRSHPSQAVFRQSNSSKEFTTTDETGLRQMEYIKRGNILHHIFSRIPTTDDIGRILTQMTMEGILYDEVKPAELQRMLHKALANEQVREWFSPRWKVLNETTLLVNDPDTCETVQRRPDRVMVDGDELVVVDFKFAKQDEEHLQQVRGYMGIFQKLGYTQVRGYVWYVATNKIIEV